MRYTSKSQYPLIENEGENYKKYSGIPGIYAIYEKNYSNEPLYIGFTLDLHRRCMLDHQKPSQFLAQRIIEHKIGSKEKNFDSYSTYHRIVKLFLNELEFRVIKTFSKNIGKNYYIKDIAKAQESILLEVFKPIYNIRHK